MHVHSSSGRVSHQLQNQSETSTFHKVQFVTVNAII
jgi:hypothetical protein